MHSLIGEPARGRNCNRWCLGINRNRAAHIERGRVAHGVHLGNRKRRRARVARLHRVARGVAAVHIMQWRHRVTPDRHARDRVARRERFRDRVAGLGQRMRRVVRRFADLAYGRCRRVDCDAGLDERSGANVACGVDRRDDNIHRSVAIARRDRIDHVVCISKSTMMLGLDQSIVAVDRDASDDTGRTGVDINLAENEVTNLGQRRIGAGTPPFRRKRKDLRRNGIDSDRTRNCCSRAQACGILLGHDHVCGDVQIGGLHRVSCLIAVTALRGYGRAVAIDRYSGHGIRCRESLGNDVARFCERCSRVARSLAALCGCRNVCVDRDRASGIEGKRPSVGISRRNRDISRVVVVAWGNRIRH